MTVTRSDGALTATWPAASDATKYHVTYSTDNRQSWSLAALNHTTNSITISGDNAKTYIVGVRAGNDGGWSGWRNSPAAGPYTPPNANPPDPVASVSLTRADGAVTADWPAASRATHYHVTYTTDNGKSWSLAALSHTTTSLTISKADNAKTYVVGVRAGNAHGWSGWVNSPAIGPYTPPPAAPTGLTSAGGDQSVTLAWSDPSDASITGYEYAVQQAGHDQGEWTGIPDSDAATMSYTASGLTNGTAYTLHLRALNAGGSGAAAQASATPKAPVIVVTAARGNDGDTAGVSWTAYAGDDFEYYRVIVCNASQYDGSSCSGTVFASTPSYDANDTGPVTVPGLNAGTGYGIILQVWRNGSALKRHATLSAPSLNVDGVDGAAAAVTLANHNGQWYYTIENDDPGPEGDGAYGAALANNGPTCTGPVNGAQATVTGSVYGSNYTLNAYTDPNCGGASIASAEFRIQSTEPPANQAGVCTYFYDRSGEGDWSGEYSLQAESDGRIYRNFTEYRFLRHVDPNDHSGPHVDAACANTSTWQRAYWQPNTSADPISIRWKTREAGYWACDHYTGVGPNPPDPNACPTVQAPLAPKVLNVTRGNGRLNLSWRAPLTRGSSLTGYQAQCSTNSGRTWVGCGGAIAASGNAGDLLTHTVGRVANSSVYTVRIRATSAAGNSQWTTSAIVAAISVSNVGQTTATITLNGYTGNWYYKADTGPDAAACKGPISGATAVDLMGLTASTPYTYRAYDDSTCISSAVGGTAKELAFASFTTIEITLTASNVTGTGATLTIANHSGDWYYQHSGQGASCQGPVAGNSQSLTTLTSGTSYTYSAYSDAGCATLLATAATFTVGQHHVSNLSSVKSGGAVTDLSHKEASAFTTGSNANGYTLTSVTLPLRKPTTADAELVITLHAMEGSAAYGTGSAPSATVLATLAGTDPTGEKWADTTYTCSGNGCSLSANTTYFLVASALRGPYAWAYTTTNPHPEHTYPANSGWDIGYSHSKAKDRSWKSFGDWHLIRIDFTTDAGGTGTAQAAPVVVATATVRGTTHPVDPAGAAAQAANIAGNAANAHDGIGRHEAATASAARSPGYVTNLASAQSGDSDVDATQRQAVAFTTGPSPGGYTLKRFTAALRKVSGNADLVLTLHDMASTTYGDDSQPAPTVLATLSGSAPASGAYTDVTYACSGAGCVLAPDTTYFVVVQSSGTGAYAWAYVASANLYTETTVPSGSGWTLGASHYAQDGEAWASFGDWHHARLDFETHPVLSVGNLAEAPHPDACFPSGDARCAVGFTTGSAAGGYTLRALTARFGDADDPDGNLGDLVVTLHADAAGLPGPALTTLNGDNPTEAGDYTYTCSGAGCALKPDTTYFVQVSATAGAYLSEAYAWSATLSDHETQVPAGNGWTLANGTAAYRSTWQAYPDVGLLAIVATR